MDLSDLVTADRVFASLHSGSKKQVLQDLASRASEASGIDTRVIFEALIERERLGSTGVGHGIAIPHARLADMTQLEGFFARLETPIEFDAVDSAPVDLVFLLLVPEESGADHLKALARISRLLRNEAVTNQLRSASTVAELFQTLTRPAESHAA
ncbi:PTS IIA-like nitrogen regulatory protein PtsN [Pyruvatibacter sp.]|uniref:PTS IIA-like nitrogen regulatory protein PtsN n=1 Tax=Pyruvatibacter sp. TaxID=1981328 RepID=UPI0032EED5A7